MDIENEKIRVASQASSRLDTHLSRIRDSENRILERARRISGGSYQPKMQNFGYAETTASPTLSEKSAGLLERVIGKTDDIVSIEFLETGLLAHRSVGRIWDGDRTSSTGFHIGLGLVMTAGHSLPSAAYASDQVLQMNYEEQSVGTPRRPSEFFLDPETFFLRDDDFDVAICAATEPMATSPSLDSFGWQVLSAGDENIDTGTPISIVQHPDGKMKSLVVHNSHFVDTGKDSEDDRYCWYTADTRPGSSGAPVFAPNWRILALHHSAIPARDPTNVILDRKGRPIHIDGIPVTTVEQLKDLSDVSFFANEGIRASRLVRWLTDVSISDPKMSKLRKELLNLWERPGAHRIAHQAAVEGMTAS